MRRGHQCLHRDRIVLDEPEGALARSTLIEDLRHLARRVEQTGIRHLDGTLRPQGVAKTRSTEFLERPFVASERDLHAQNRSRLRSPSKKTQTWLLVRFEREYPRSRVRERPKPGPRN